MLTAEHEVVDLSLLLNEGVLGLAQTALRLAGQLQVFRKTFRGRGGGQTNILRNRGGSYVGHKFIYFAANFLNFK